MSNENELKRDMLIEKVVHFILDYQENPPKANGFETNLRLGLKRMYQSCRDNELRPEKEKSNSLRELLLEGLRAGCFAGALKYKVEANVWAAK